MNELSMVIWTAFNVVFALTTAKWNIMAAYAKFTGESFSYTPTVWWVDKITAVSLLSQVLYLWLYY